MTLDVAAALGFMGGCMACGLVYWIVCKAIPIDPTKDITNAN
jgi:sulfite exporter TauE/SafE